MLRSSLIAGLFLTLSALSAGCASVPREGGPGGAHDRTIDAPPRVMRSLHIDQLGWIGHAVFFTEDGQAYVMSNPGGPEESLGLYTDAKISPDHKYIVLTRDDSVIELRPVAVPVCIGGGSAVRSHARTQEFWIECADFPPESGEIVVGVMDGNATMVSGSRSDVAGVFTNYAGVQSLVFRSSSGETFGCPGVFYLGLANFFEPSEQHTGGVDWAFVIEQHTNIPEWVTRLAAGRRAKYQSNAFLVRGKKFVPTKTPTSGQSGRGTSAHPESGEGFGDGKRVLTVGTLSRRDWSICFD